jgi:hypothetical protein
VSTGRRLYDVGVGDLERRREFDELNAVAPGTREAT